MENTQRKKRRGVHTSFRLRISLTFVSIVVVIVVSMAAVLSNYFKERSLESIRGAIDMAVSVNAGEVKRLVDRVENAIDVIHDNDDLYLGDNAEVPEVIKMICRYKHLPDNSDLYELKKAYANNTERIENLFEDCFDGAGVAYMGRVFVDENYPITRWLNHETALNTSGNIFVSDRSVSGTEWFQKAKQLDGATYWFTLPENESWLYLTKQFKYRYVQDMALTEEHFAVLTVGFETAWIAERINASAVTENACIWIEDKQSQIVYSSDAAITRLFADLEWTQMDDTVSHMVDGEEYLLQKTALDDELFMVISVPMEDISNINAGMGQMVVLVAIVILLGGILLTVLLSVYVAQPIGRLADHMRSGRLETIEVKNRQDDEVSLLYTSFNGLIIRLREMFRNVIEASEKKKQAEIRALQAQINPHFVYNTLNSIASVELLSGRHEVADVIGYLSQMLRYSIKHPDALATLADEVKNIKSYISIQQFCYRNRISFEYRIDPETEKITLPKVIIQPLVENSLIHGTNILENDARVCLSSALEGQQLVIRVWDNGISADVDRINSYLRGKDEFGKSADSLGLRNVFERIRMVYGEAGSLHYETDEAGCTVAVIRLPAKGEECV